VVTDNGTTSVSVQYNGYDDTDVSRTSLSKNYTGLTAPPTPGGQSGSWTLRFADEFTGTTLSTGNWRSGSFPWGDRWIPSNTNEREWYDPAAVTVSSGTCKITAHAQADVTVPAQTWRSGLIHSQKRFDFVYGFAEARMMLPTALGVWPAFWMAPSDESWPPEIDIMEAYGSDAANIYASNFHYDIGAGATNVGAQDHTLSSSRVNWHTYGMRWTPTQITFWADNTLVRTVTTGTAGARNVPMYLLLNLAISDSQGGMPGSDQVMEIDYVRVWEG
jgi:beta-glucanase (GH16 family)